MLDSISKGKGQIRADVAKHAHIQRKVVCARLAPCSSFFMFQNDLGTCCGAQNKLLLLQFLSVLMSFPCELHVVFYVRLSSHVIEDFGT